MAGWRIRRGWAFVGAVVVVLGSTLGAVALGAAVVRGGDEEDGSIVYAETVDVTAAPSLGSSSSEVLAGVVGLVASPHILSTSLGSAPMDFRENGYLGTWVYATVDAPRADGPGVLRAVWDATVAVGAFREEVYRAGLPAPEGYGVSVRRPDGSVDPYMAWPFADIEYGQRFAPEGSEAMVERKIRDAVLAAGLEPIGVDAVVATDVAMAVVSRIRPTTRVLGRTDVDELVASVFGKLADYEGVYFELQNNAGKPLFVLARSFRTGDGLSYAAPQLGLQPLRGPPAF